MPQTNKLDAVAETEFRSEVGEELRANNLIYDEFLKAGGNVNTNFVGEAIKAPHAGKLFARPRGERTSVVDHQALAWKQKSAVAEEHTVLTYAPNLASTIVSFNERQTLVKAVKYARDLRASQYIIDELEKSSAASTTTNLQDDAIFQLGTEGTPITKFDTAFLIKLNELFNAKNISSKGRVIFINSTAQSHLFEDEKFISSDYNRYNTLNDASVVDYMGFKLIAIDNDFDPETGEKFGLQYDNVSQTVSLYAMHVSALYPVYSQIENGTLDIAWEHSRRSHGIAADVRGGCLILDEKKIAKIVLDNTSDFTLPE